MSDLHERCRKAEAEVAHLQRELTYAKNSFEAQKFLQHREWERAVQAERERDENEGAFKVWRRRCQEAEQERDTLRALLREMEWANAGRILPGLWCPFCGQGKQQGHAPDCRLDAVLKEANRG